MVFAASQEETGEVRTNVTSVIFSTKDAKYLVALALTAALYVGCLARQGSASQSRAQPVTPGKLHAFNSVSPDAYSYPYLLYLPKGYGQNQRQWPMILYLHGSQDRGEDLDMLKLRGIPRVAEEDEGFPFVAVSPQSPGTQGGWSRRRLMNLLNSVVRNYDVDERRIYVTGISMGGFAAWELGCAYPERFAAVAPISCWGNPKAASRLKNVGVWGFVAAKDPYRTPERMKKMVNAINACGGDAKLTICAEGKRDVWNVAYSKEKLFDWLLGNRKSKKANDWKKGIVLAPRQHHKTFAYRTNETASAKTTGCKYLLFLPDGYGSRQQEWPLILYLHGASLRGNDLERLKAYGLPSFVDIQESFPFILVSPQCPARKGWSSVPLIALLDEVIRQYSVDQARIYLTGPSMGGFGAWYLACAHPDRFAAVAPICGGGPKKEACALANVPVWAFHGEQDRVVSLRASEEMVNAVNDCGGNARLTIYPEVGHDSFNITYNDDELYDWFLEHRIGGQTK